MPPLAEDDGPIGKLGPYNVPKGVFLTSETRGKIWFGTLLNDRASKI